MMAEFQIFFRQARAGALVPELESTLIRAERAQQALELARGLGIEPVSVGPGRVLLEPHQQTFDRAEAAAYLCSGVSTVDALMAAGDLPRAKSGRPLFPRRVLDLVVEKRMGILQWENEQRKAA
jgi:hypothetical protein